MNMQEKNREEWNINPEHFLSMKGDEIWIFWKNQESIYLGCNDLMATELGLKSKADILGRSDYDFPVSKHEADSYREQDQQVMESGHSLQFKDTASLPKHIIQFEVIKIPIFKGNKNYGLIGLSHYKKIQANQAAWVELYNNKYLQQSNLTLKEAEILYYLLCGKSLKEIAKLMFRSLRTIEKHIENIKAKTGCQSKYTLIQKFLHLIIS